MNVSRNHLVNEEEFKRLIAEKPSFAQSFTPVPNFLENAATKKLNGKKEAKVSFKSGGKLSNWAKKVRKNLNIQENE